MKTAHDYETLAYLGLSRPKPDLLETYSGKSIVMWHGKIEGQLQGLVDDSEKGRNFPYADKLREYLKIWRANEITGSINREQLETLKAAADVLSVDNWDMATYFRSLRDQLRVLIASEEELPRDIDMNQNDPYAGGMGGGGGGPPMSPSFGPDEKGGPGGGEGGPGAPGGAASGGPAGAPSGPPGAGGAPPEGAAPPGAPGPGEPEAPGAEPGAPAPEGNGTDQVKPEDMPDERRFGEL
jgi:hypothetical protein